MSSAHIDRLESRTHFAGGPTVTSSLFVGDHNAISALVIGFDQPLDPVAAENLDNFRLSGRRNSGRAQNLPFAAATYNADNFTVTLTRTDLFSLRYFRRLNVVVRSEKAGEVADPSGVLVDGDRDGVAGGDLDLTFRAHRSRTFAYRDIDGDRVTLKASGAEGRRPLFCLSVKKGNVHQAWVDGFRNRLTGNVKPTRTSNGTTDIGRVVLVHASNTNELPPEFIVGQTVGDGQAPVDPLIRTL